MTTKKENYGIVYVLTNPAMPDMVKIGMTNKENVEAQMKELFNTSVPVPFQCEYACKVTDCALVEKALHIAFHPYRINAQREFFEINPEQAIAILKLLDKSSDITSEVVEEINNDLSDGDRLAGMKMKKKKRPPLNFTEMGFRLGLNLSLIAMERAMWLKYVMPKRSIMVGRNLP
ncbi:MAG: GIY-YIG nuclease family protein [Bacteroidota bacterium]|nr:GIY-YIG nuclease family protein [Bacteroidota bacterium]